MLNNGSPQWNFLEVMLKALLKILNISLYLFKSDKCKRIWCILNSTTQR